MALLHIHFFFTLYIVHGAGEIPGAVISFHRYKTTIIISTEAKRYFYGSKFLFIAHV